MKTISKKIYIIVKNLFLSVLFIGIILKTLTFYAPMFRFEEDAISSGNLQTFYAQDKDSIDVAFVGSSALYRFISPTEIYKNYGYTSANYATANMSAFCMPGVIDELLDHQSPKVIVIEIRNYVNNVETEMKGGKYTKKELLEKESMFNRLVNNMPPSLNRMKVIHDTVPNMLDKKGLKQNEFDWQFEYPKTHTNWKTLSFSDVFEYTERNLSSEKTVDDFDGAYYGVNYKGTVAKSDVEYFEDRDFSDYNEKSEISGYWLDVMQKVVDKAKSCETKVMFLTTPYPQEAKKVAYENFLSDYFAEQGVDFLNCNRLYKEIGIDFSTDFYDEGHANTSGMVKVTNYLGKYLADKYNLKKTKLTAEQQAEWEIASEKWITEVREPGLKKISDYVANQKELGNKNYLD